MQQIPSGLLSLRPGDELQILTAVGVIVISIDEGVGLECFGEPIVPKHKYVLCPFASYSFLAQLPCQVRVCGHPHAARVIHNNEGRNCAILNLATSLNRLRSQAFADDGRGPSVLVLGGLGKTATCQTLNNYAFRSGWSPTLIDLDCRGRLRTQPHQLSTGAGCVQAIIPEVLTPSLEKLLERVSAATGNEKMQIIREASVSQTSGHGPGDSNKLKYRRRRPQDLRSRTIGIISGLGRRGAAVFSEEKDTQAEESVQGRRTGGSAPLTLSSWERYTRPLVIAGDSSSVEEIVSVCVGTRCLETSEGQQLLCQATRQLMKALSALESRGACQEADDPLRQRLLRASGRVVDVPSDLDINTLTVLIEACSPDLVVVLGEERSLSLSESTCEIRYIPPSVVFAQALNTPPMELIPQILKQLPKIRSSTSADDHADYVRACMNSDCSPPPGISCCIPARILLAPLILPAYVSMAVRATRCQFVKRSADQGTILISAAEIGVAPLLGALLCASDVKDATEQCTVLSPALVQITREGSLVTLWIREKKILSNYIICLID